MSKSTKHLLVTGSIAFLSVHVLLRLILWWGLLFPPFTADERARFVGLVAGLIFGYGYAIRPREKP